MNQYQVPQGYSPHFYPYHPEQNVIYTYASLHQQNLTIYNENFKEGGPVFNADIQKFIGKTSALFEKKVEELKEEKTRGFFGVNGNNNWTTFNIGGGRSGKGAALVLVGLAALSAAFSLGVFYNNYSSSQDKLRKCEKGFGNQMTQWKNGITHINANEHFKTLEKLYHAKKDYYQIKTDNAIINLALSVGFLTTGILTAAGLIVAFDALAAGGALTILGLGVITLIRLGYRTFRKNPEDKLAKQMRKVCENLHSVTKPLKLEQVGPYTVQWA